MPVGQNKSTLVHDPLPLVIANPKSASGATRDNWAATAADLRAHFGPFAVAFTKYPGHAIELAENAALSGKRLIIACGGDGTINEVANGIVRSGTDSELGILPSGTGGDFRRSLEIPTSNRDAARALRFSKCTTIDIGKVTFLDRVGNRSSRYFLNVSSVGLAADVIKRVKSSSVFDWFPIGSLKGRANFAVSAAQEIMAIKPVSLLISVDGKPDSRIQSIAFCVANARYFGGGMMIAPDARLADGALDLVNVGDISALRVIANAHTLYRGTHIELDEVGSTTARRVAVASSNSEKIDIEVDGELLGSLPATFEIVPSALRVRVPDRSDRP